VFVLMSAMRVRVALVIIMGMGMVVRWMVHIR
jgi:hypothetical protein